jgi:histidine triad (HIT) family protein
MSERETLFTKIIRGEIPCHKVYEDDLVFAFLDIGPLTAGHTLVVPKEPAATLDELSGESAAAIGRVLPKMVRAVMRVTGAPASNVIQNNGALANQSVDHVHFHVIPKHTAQDGLVLNWVPGSLDSEEGAAMATRIGEALQPSEGAEE